MLRMRVALIGPEIEENLSLRYVAASLAAAGVESDIVPFNGEEDFAAALEATLAVPRRLVGISLAFQWRAKDFLALAMALRERGYAGHITLGGHFATFAHEDLLRDFGEVDSICRQEAEETMVALERALADGSPLLAIPGLTSRRTDGSVHVAPPARLPELDRLPWPDRRGAPAACFGHAIAPLVTSRGCYANCTFCCIAAWHEQSLPGKRYRLRDLDDVAREMVHMQRTRGVEIFVFHDDNFFVRGKRQNAARLEALADALDRRGIGPFATVVKARPTDCHREAFTVLKERLNCIRVYVGIETDADQGLVTLRRWASAEQNRLAVELVRSLDLYTCFNMLLFDPDTTLDSIETNIQFMREVAELPSNFGRVELYAGTPLLARMIAEQRVHGDYMQWDYALASTEVERIFAMTMEAFYPRNFGPDALANRLMATRFDVEVCKHFHRDLFDPAWAEQAKDLSRRLGTDSADGLATIVEHVKSGGAAARDVEVARAVGVALRETERVIRAEARALARGLLAAVGRGSPLTDLGDRVATPLQTAREVRA